MDLIAKVIGSPRGIFALSSVTAVLTGFAIVAFGVPPVVLVPIAWGGGILLAESNDWVNRRLGRR